MRGDPTKKMCPGCHKILPIEDFLNSKGNKMTYCRPCQHQVNIVEGLRRKMLRPKRPRKPRRTNGYYEKV
jgi:NAD-dependent SIR2 family protein deacetylase